MPEIPANRRFAPFPHTSGLSDYEAAEARQAFGQSIAVAIRAYGRKPMFTVKPANDTDNFYAVIKRLEAQRILEEVSHSPEYIAELEKMAEEIARNRRNLPHPSTPSSSAGDTFRVPSQPHAADVS